MNRSYLSSLTACVLAAAPLAGCAAGRSFSIAMANPGSLHTVLVVGDVGAPPIVQDSGAHGAPQITPPPAALFSAASGAARVGGQTGASQAQGATSLQAQMPTTLTLSRPGLSASVPATVTVGAAAPSPQPASSSIGLQVSPALLAPTTVSVAAGPVSATVGVVPGSTGLGGSNAAATALPASASLTTPAAAAGAQIGPSAITATASSLIGGSQVTAQLGGGLSTSASVTTTPVAVVAALGGGRGLQVQATSPVVSNLGSTLAKAPAQTVQGLQATLGAVGGATTLAAPSPGASTPTASALKGLLVTTVKKPKRG